MVGALPRRDAAACRCAASLTAPQTHDEDLPENYRAFRLCNNLGPEAEPRMGGHESEGRHTGARQCAPLLHRVYHDGGGVGGFDTSLPAVALGGAAGRMGRQQRRHRRAAHQSDAAHRDGQCADGAFSRLGHAQHTTTCQPLSDSARASAGGTDQGSQPGFPTIPGLRPTAPEPGFINPLLDYHGGSGFDPNDGSGAPSNAVPPIKQVIKSLVPKVDADGNRNRGVPVVLRQAPLGTYLGWNIIADSTRPFHMGKLCGNACSIIPLEKTKA